MTKKKKILIITLSIIAVIAIAVGVTLGVLLTRKPEEAPVTEGAIYQTESKIIWSGVAGVAYISFEYVEEPEVPEEDQLYGYVFKVMADSSTDVSKCTPWLIGTWELEETDGTYGLLKLTATWDTSNSNAITITGAESGKVKTYSLEDGVYKIGISFPSGADLIFTLDPTKKLNGGETVKPSEPCTEHVDVKNNETGADGADGKCDKCGEDMPKQEVKVSATLSAETSTIKSKIELMTDNTWTLSMCYYGDEYTPSADGRWSMNTDTYAIILVVENDPANMLADNSYELDINYETQKYSKTIAITMPESVPTIGGMALDFAFAQEAEAPAEKVVAKTLNADNGAQKAKIELYEDKTWGVSICFYGDNYSPMASGTWELDTTTYNIVLTVTGDEADVLAEETYTLGIDYQTHEYSVNMTLNVPSVGPLTFEFDSAVVTETHYTVEYDLNYPGAPAGGTAETKTFKLNGVSKEYIDVAPAIPTREGYKFAGWYTVKDPTFTNGASDQEYLFGTKLETAYNQPPEHLTNDVTEISGNTTLYARWVEVKEISTAEQLKEMANDLTGWYKLTADIDLTEAWTPIGMYYANYEFYQPSWWLYSFRGTLDGNGHKITGLQLNTLTFADNAITETEGSANGTTALFGSAVNCTVKDLTIEGAIVTVTDYEANNHAYVSVLAAFVQGTNTLFENCTVKDTMINVSTKNVWYVSVAGLFGGHWGGNAKNCNVVNSTITVSTAFDKILEGYPYEAVYVGGLVGEGYAWMKNCTADVDISYTLNDSRSATAEDVPVNIYLGGAMGSSTYLQGVVYEGDITFNYTKAVGKADVYFGGLSGLQRYGYVNNCMSKANMVYNNNNGADVEGQTLSVGGILGANDTLYGVMGYAYFYIPNGCRVNNCIDMATLTKNGTVVSDLQTIGRYALYDAEVKAYAEALGADVSSFTNADGYTSNFFGAFNCVKVRDSAAEADANGTVTVANESDLHGEALKNTLGENWNYIADSLPTPKTVE